MVEKNNGECPCHNTGTDKHCPCSDYRENDICHCGLYLKASKVLVSDYMSNAGSLEGG